MNINALLDVFIYIVAQRIQPSLGERTTPAHSRLTRARRRLFIRQLCLQTRDFRLQIINHVLIIADVMPLASDDDVLRHVGLDLLRPIGIFQGIDGVVILFARSTHGGYHRCS